MKRYFNIKMKLKLKDIKMKYYEIWGIMKYYEILKWKDNKDLSIENIIM